MDRGRRGEPPLPSSPVSMTPAPPRLPTMWLSLTTFPPERWISTPMQKLWTSSPRISMPRIDDREARIGQGPYVRTVLTFGRAGAGALPPVLDEAGPVERDKLAGSPPRHGLDPHRPLDRREQ